MRIIERLRERPIIKALQERRTVILARPLIAPPSPEIPPEEAKPFTMEGVSVPAGAVPLGPPPPTGSPQKSEGFRLRE